MQKFEDIDIIETLRQIMLTNTEHFTDDFDYDIKAIRKAAHSDKAEDKNCCGSLAFVVHIVSMKKMCI